MARAEPQHTHLGPAPVLLKSLAADENYSPTPFPPTPAKLVIALPGDITPETICHPRGPATALQIALSIRKAEFPVVYLFCFSAAASPFLAFTCFLAIL